MDVDTGKERRLRAVIYLRQSLDRSGEGAAVERQHEDCRALANLRAWEVVEVITENSVSASTGKDRPGYLRVLELIRAGAIDRVIVYHVDRLYRSMIDLEHLVLLSESTGVRIATVTGDLDLSTDTGRLLARILAAIARGEVERKSARQKRANLQRREQGAAQWTRRPFAYDRDDDGHPILVSDEAAALKMAAAAILGGGTLAAGARMLDEGGFETTAGKPWNVRTLSRALRSPRYVSRVTYLGEATGVDGTWPPLWDETLHTQLVEILTDPGRRIATSTTLIHWLSGAMYCGKCEALMWSGVSHRHEIYRCRTGHLTRDRTLVEDVVSTRLKRRLAHPAFRASFETVDSNAGLRNTLAELRRAQADVADMMADRLMPAETARPRLARLAREIEEAEGRLASSLPSGPLAELARATDPDAKWDLMLPRERRITAAAMAERITIEPVGKAIKDRVEKAKAVRIDWR